MVENLDLDALLLGEVVGLYMGEGFGLDWDETVNAGALQVNQLKTRSSKGDEV